MSKGVDPHKVLRTIGAAATGIDVSETRSYLIKRIFGTDAGSNTAKTLTSELVHLGSLHDSDLEIIILAVKARLNSSDVESQIVALQILPSLPPQYLIRLVLKDAVGDFIVECLNDGHAVIRCASVSALKHFLTDIDVVKSLSEHPESVQACIEYWKHICDYLVDPDDLVAGAAFGAILSLIEKHNAMKAASIASPWSVLFERWHDLCFTSLTTHLTAVLHRSSQLDAAGLVTAIRVVFAVSRKLLEPNHSKSPLTHLHWIIPSVGIFFEECLSSIDAAVAHQAGICLLQLCKLCGENVSKSWGVIATISLESWSSKAILTLENLLSCKEFVPARGDLTLTITRHLEQLEMLEVGIVTRRLLQSISTLPRSSDRTRSLMFLWRAVLSCDLKARRIRHSRGDALPNTSLQAILEDPFFSGVVAGNVKQSTDVQLGKAISKASYPAFKQELVSTLVEVTTERVQSWNLQSIFPPKLHSEPPSPKEMSLESAILSDLQVDVIDWFAASVVVLYLTQACLGWDNQSVDGYYGLTLPSDLWLQLLQLTAQTLYRILAHYNIHFYVELRNLDEEMSKTKVGKVLKTLAGEAFEIQKLMKRMVFFWSFLNSALKPRVFWVVCHHIELPDRSDDIWTYLRDGLKDLLITRPTETSKRQQENRIEASRKGKMGPESDSVYTTKGTLGETKKAPFAYSHSEVALEGVTVGLVCLQKLADALTIQYSYATFPKYYHQVRGIAEMIKKVCHQMLEEDFLTVDMFDQCTAILKQLDYIIEHAPEGATMSPDQSAPNDPADAEHAVTYLHVDLAQKTPEGFPFSNAGSTAFISNKRMRRHHALRLNLQKGLVENKLLEKSVSKKKIELPIPEKPTAVDLAAVVGGLGLKEDETDWKILTGQGDPIELSMRHQVDAFMRVLEVEIRAENRMGSSDITGVVVSFALEGPVMTDREGLIVWHPEKLSVQEAATHRFQLGLMDFGSIHMQPYMDVALQGTEELSALSCSAYTIPLSDLLVPVVLYPSAKVFFQEVVSWPDSVSTTAVCRWPGTQGGMQLLSALQRPQIKRIWPQKIHSLGILQVVYLLQTFNDFWASLAITGQLVDLERMGLAAWALRNEVSATGNTGYYLCKCTFASTSPTVIASIRAQTGEFLSNLSSGGLITGLDPGVGQPPPPPPIHPENVIDLGSLDSTNLVPDLQSLALEHWKRLNQARLASTTL